MSNYKTVFFTLGILQIILGVAMFIPIIAQFVYSEIDSSFFGASIITIIFGTLFFLSNLDHNKKLNLQQAFLLTALSWLSIAIFGSLPFIFSTIELSVTDAFFESMSGITTTGSTIISNLEITPKGILLWRAILQWLGGIGIIVMAITLMPIMNVGGMQLFKISSNDSSEKILPKSKEIALRLIYIYLILTALCAVTYWLFGMGKFDSLTHSMTTIATGGFSNYNQSIGYFDNVSIEISSMVFIILGSLPFIVYIKFISGNRKIFLKDVQIKTFLKIIIISIIILSIYLLLNNSKDFNLRSVFFNTISILTGTGYVSAEFDGWGSFPLTIFLALMFIGGCAGSTTCGVKIFRVQILYLFILNQLKKIIYPKGIFIIKYEQNSVDDKFISSIISFIYLYFVIFFLLAESFFIYFNIDKEVAVSALSYGNILLGGIFLIWLFNIIISVTRGSGNTLVPAYSWSIVLIFHIVIACTNFNFENGTIILVKNIKLFNEVFIFSALQWSVISLLSGYFVGIIFVIGFYYFGKHSFSLNLRDVLKFDGILKLFKSGSLASCQSLMTIALALFCTTVISIFGTNWTAGFGIAIRLELLLIPIIFGIGGALIAIVGANVGAKKFSRAIAMTWKGTFFSVFIVGFIGLFFSIYPDLWSRHND